MVARLKRRKAINFIMMSLTSLSALLGISILALILGHLLFHGISAMHFTLFTMDTPPPNALGGLRNAMVGSLVMTVIAVLIGAPIGVLAGTWLAEFGRKGTLASIIRFINDILLSAPSIIVGLFIYQVMVVTMGGFSGIAGAVALSILVIPIVVRTTEDMLRLVPDGLREAGMALGVPRWLIIRKVVYAAARAGLVTGVLLAIARILGETAPLLFTALNNQFFSLHLGKPMASLPNAIYQFALSPYANWQKLAWAGAFLITALVLTLNILARVATASHKEPT